MSEVKFTVTRDHYSISGVPVLTLSQNRKIEQDFGSGVETFPLMQAAALGIFQRIKEVLPSNILEKRWVIFAGNGNNGGDGYEIASNLVAQGCRDTVVLLVKPPKKEISASRARERYLDAGGIEFPLYIDECVSLDADGYPRIQDQAQEIALKADYIVDAIAGIGVGSDFDCLREGARKQISAIRLINRCSKATVLAVDIPSLLNANTGNPVVTDAVHAHYTFSVFGYRFGILFGQAADFCGCLIPVYPVIGDVCNQIKSEFDISPCLAFDYAGLKDVLPTRKPTAHKGNAGRILLVGGGKGMHGALMISSMGALRTGGGLITACFADEGGILPLNVAAPEIMSLSADDNRLNKLLETVDVQVLGPGLGRDIEGKRLFDTVWQNVRLNKKIVIDADGLWHLHNLYQIDGMQNDVAVAKGIMILTPHVGEAAMLLDKTVGDVQADPIGSAKLIATRYHATCILKSNRTVIASEEKEPVLIGVVGSQAMASGGMGDLLSGITASLWAVVQDPIVASSMAVAIHGQAGMYAAKEGGMIGTCATDLLPYIRLLRNSREID